MNRTPGPDFICVGAPKAGTRWLYDQLQYHPDFWMPPIKEFRYLDHPYPKMKNAVQFVQLAARSPDRVRRRLAKRGAREWTSQDLEFLREASALDGERMDILRYNSLFRFKGELLSGDISPGYSGLDDEVVKQVAEHIPQTKIVFLVRDPVARVWSGISMLYRHGKFDADILSDPRRFREELERRTGMKNRSAPTEVVERWTRCAPAIPFRYFLFDEIESDPEESRRKILLYLGADPGKASGELPANHNRKAKAEKLPLAEPIKAVLVDYFKDEMRACAKVFGGHAQAWLTRYGL